MLCTYITVIEGLVTLLVWVLCLYGSQKRLRDYQTQNIHNVPSAYQDRVHSSLIKSSPKMHIHADLSKIISDSYSGKTYMRKSNLHIFFSLCS